MEDSDKVTPHTSDSKLEHLEHVITQRDEIIEELTVSLQRSRKERDDLTEDVQHLSNEVYNLQHLVSETSEHDTVKGQLSDFMKYSSMVKDDSTKFYSALMSGGSSIQSSNGEKDMENEEMTINYSKSKTSDSSDDFQIGIENKLSIVINKFGECIEDNLRNKLREAIIQVLFDEIGKMRIDYDTEVRGLESQMQRDKQSYSVETRKLRELLSSVKTDNVDINALRQELSIKHEKEMENLRTYFEKKCCDMEKSYSEEVWRGKACASPGGSMSSMDCVDYGAGDQLRRRTRSAELPSLNTEQVQQDQLLKQIAKRFELQIEDMRNEHITYVNELQANNRETIAALEDQITQLKAHIQTTENTEGNVPMYQQDIDLELEKAISIEERVEEVKQEIFCNLQEQLQVLLSDPDADLSSWPIELVALRQKIHGEKPEQAEKELSSLRDEAGGEGDKWKQRRNISFDQNRHLEEVTKERDSLKRVAVSLQKIVNQLVAYCAAADDELNKTVLTSLLARLVSNDNTTFLEDSRPTTPNLSISLNSSLVKSNKHVHFAPDLQTILADLDEDDLVGFLEQQRDVSLDIKRELELSLKRLRVEAQELLELSSRVGNNKRQSEANMLESSQLKITDLVEKLDRKQNCDNCELHRKDMEEAMADCVHRENLLRTELEAAMMKIAQLMSNGDRLQSDVVVEGYGTYTQPASLPARGRPRPPDSAPLSLDGCSSPRLVRMAHDMDSLLKDRDDLQQQLEAANRQLRSTRQFIDEQAAEREAERDEFARRLSDLREENSRLSTRLQTNARILSEMHRLQLAHCHTVAHAAHVEQLEAQTREMNQIINELETKKTATDEELKSSEEKIALQADIIENLENQLEKKTAEETEVLKQLDEMRRTIDERDSKMREVVGELESLRTERVEQSDVMCVKCGLDEDKYGELLEKLKEQTHWLEDKIHYRTLKLERVHDVCSASCSEPSEDVSLRDQKNRFEVRSQESIPSPRAEPTLPELQTVWACLETHSRAEDAALKRLADLDMQREQLKDVAQELRAERDVLQARMSEQALRISSLSARLDQQRHNAEALAHQAASQLSVQLSDTTAEVHRLKDELESKDKQILRLKQTLEDRDKQNELHNPLYGSSGNPKDKALERELSTAQSRIAQLEHLLRGLESDKEELLSNLREHQRALAEREEQLNELLALKLEDEQKDEKSEILDGAKISARTLSDIVSISEFDEQDLQMRRAELKAQNVSLTGAPYATEINKSLNNRTPHPDINKQNMSSLNIEYGDHFDVENFTPRADSLPAHLTSTQNTQKFKRNVNETTIFGVDKSLKHSTALNIPDNCSMYPNREIDDSKHVSVDPKKIDFSLEASQDNKTQEEFTSLRELGITLDIKKENFPDILTQLKHEIKKSRTELENCRSELKNAEEQLCEFPALKEEVEELKKLLENTMATMENDKKFYENQLENFSSNKKLLEQRLKELSEEVKEKSNDLHLLKEDILRRENMILELAKEKRNLTNKLADLELKIEELRSRNTTLEKYESENHQMKEKIAELKKLEQLVSEKNQQIDSLNQHLDRLDDLQRRLSDKNEEFDNLKEAFEEKSNGLFHLQDTVESLNRDIAKLNEDNKALNTNNIDLKQKLSKVEKEQENSSLKLQNSESELNSLNTELTTKIDELKSLTDKLKDKETEIEILHEDINAFHEEIASLKEQLQIVSRSPSPKNKNGEEKKCPEKQASADKKQLVKIRKQISLLQHELDFNKKELNDKAFELAKARLDVTELKNNLSQSLKQLSDKEIFDTQMRQEIQRLREELRRVENERDLVRGQLEEVVARIREESNVEELRMKLQRKAERCEELEGELHDLRVLVERLRDSNQQELLSSEQNRALVLSGTRSPTAELERAVREQLDYSHSLDEHIMEQILSASSDDREEIPRLALNSSKSSSSIHSSSSERLQRLRSENEMLHLQLNNLEARLKDKDALIAELNRLRDKLVQDWQETKLRYETERDNSGHLKLLLDTHKEKAESLQNQDTNMIQILKKQLENSMKSELELQRTVEQLRSRLTQMERQLIGGNDSISPHLQRELETTERYKSEISILKAKLEMERTRYTDLQALLDHTKLHLQRELDARSEACNNMRADLAEVKRLKHDSGIELLRSKELISTQGAAIADLQRKLQSANVKQSPRIADALTEIEGHKSDLAREIATLKKCLTDTTNPELLALRHERKVLTEKVESLEKQLAAEKPLNTDEKDQAIRYLHSRCLRLESCRKALVWQKRYLQRVVNGYIEYEKTLNVAIPPTKFTGKRRFKCIATAVVASLRMQYLVRRRTAARAHAAAAILRHNSAANTPTSEPPSTPGTRGARPRGGESLARRVLKHELRVNAPPSPLVNDFARRSSYSANSPRDEPFVLSSPRGEVATAYLNKLDLVSRCLSQAMDTSRDAP